MIKMDKRDLNTIKAPVESNQIVDFISDLNKATDLQLSIQKTENEIDRLMNKVNNKIDKMVYACITVDELTDLCKSLGFDVSGKRWGMEKAYKNSMGGDTDYEKTEWSDILFHTTLDIRSFVGKKAKEKWRDDHNYKR
jgi:hypothetical protein